MSLSRIDKERIERVMEEKQIGGEAAEN